MLGRPNGPVGLPVASIHLVLCDVGDCHLDVLGTAANLIALDHG